MDQPHHKKNQFSFFEEKISPKEYEEYEESENNFQNAVDEAFAYNTASDEPRKERLTSLNSDDGNNGVTPLSKSMSLVRITKTPLQLEKLSNSAKITPFEEDEEDQPSLQSPAPRPMEKQSDFRVFDSKTDPDDDTQTKEFSEDRYKI